MTDRQTSHIAARAVYFVEILIFAAPFYLTYGMLTVVSVPYAGALLLFSPVWLASYLADANGEITSVLIIGTAVTLAAALSVTGLIALWKLARLSSIYLFKGRDELSKHRRDFRIGFYCGLAPLIFTTGIMGAIGFSDNDGRVSHLSSWVAARCSYPSPISGWRCADRTVASSIRSRLDPACSTRR